MKENKKIDQQGFSALVLVFVIALVFGLIILVMQLYLLLAARRTTQIQYTQTAFFASEGALYETIQYLRDHPSWPVFDDQNEFKNEYSLGDIDIRKKLTKLGGVIEINITATIKNTKRSLSATYTRSTVELDPLDIMLVIDRSGSMSDLGGDPPQPLTDALNAAGAFIDVIRESHDSVSGDRVGVNDRIGVIFYSTDVELYPDPLPAIYPVSYPFNEISDAIDPTKIPDFGDFAQGWTNIGGGVYEARKALLDDYYNPDAYQIIVLLTDGCATAAFATPEDDPPSVVTFETGGYDCEVWPESDTYCTHYAKTKAIEAKNDGVTIFTIGLLGYVGTEQPAAADFSRVVLGEMATKPEYFQDVYDKKDLEGVYETIAQAIISPEFYEYGETLPEPDEP